MALGGPDTAAFATVRGATRSPSEGSRRVGSHDRCLGTGRPSAASPSSHQSSDVCLAHPSATSLAGHLKAPLPRRAVPATSTQSAEGGQRTTISPRRSSPIQSRPIRSTNALPLRHIAQTTTGAVALAAGMALVLVTDTGSQLHREVSVPKGSPWVQKVALGASLRRSSTRMLLA
jgi:hypothetical protein